MGKSAAEKVIDELVDDDLIHNEKIGNSKFIWAFKSEKQQEKQKRFKQIEKELSDVAADIAIYEGRIEKAERKRQKEGREKLMAALELIDNDIKAKRDQLAQSKGLDPAELKKVEDAIEVAKAGAERWTDNMFA